MKENKKFTVWKCTQTYSKERVHMIALVKLGKKNWKSLMVKKKNVFHQADKEDHY